MLGGGGGEDDDTDIVPQIPGCGVGCGDGRCLAGSGAGAGHVTLDSGGGGECIRARGLYLLWSSPAHLTRSVKHAGELL